VRYFGDNQKMALNSLSRASYPGGGWNMGSYSRTARILESLFTRGLVDKVTPSNGWTAVIYEINGAGRTALDEIQEEAQRDYDETVRDAWYGR
jgi:DNA-binding PadR family transcriptional regulator